MSFYFNVVLLHTKARTSKYKLVLCLTISNCRLVSGSRRPGLRPGNSVAGTSRCRPVSFQRLAGRAVRSTSDSGARFRIPSPRWWLWDGGVRRAGSVGATSRTIDSIIARRLWPLQSRPVVCRCSPVTTEGTDRHFTCILI